MPAANTRSLPTGVTLDQAVIEEISRLRDAGELGRGIRVEPRCHVCCEAESRELVNKMIASGMTNREIAESCEYINARRRDKEGKDARVIGAWHVWSHKNNGHFDVDGPAVALIREIIERRANEVQRDHINGIGHAVTPYAVLETVMVTGFQKNIVNGDGPSTKETMDAAVKLHELTNRDAGQQKMADLLYKMDRIISAAQKFIPVDKHQAFLLEVQGGISAGPMEVLTEQVHESAKKAIKTFEAPRGMDEGDEI